jgi:hypothetical protein
MEKIYFVLVFFLILIIILFFKNKILYTEIAKLASNSNANNAKDLNILKNKIKLLENNKAENNSVSLNYELKDPTIGTNAGEIRFEISNNDNQLILNKNLSMTAWDYMVSIFHIGYDEKPKVKILEEAG